MNFGRIRLEFIREDGATRFALNTPKANIIDGRRIAELAEAAASCEQHLLHAIVLAADEPHFSFGGSVQEHRPEFIAASAFTSMI